MPHSSAINPASQHSFGLMILLLSSWLLTLYLSLITPLHNLSIPWIAAIILSRTFLHTGLFILAHDAMHQNLLPQYPQVNHWLGRICVGLYGFLSYQQCRINHGKHHHHPAQVGDPDFHDGTYSQPLIWYFKFLRGYLSLPGFGIFTAAWVSLTAVSYGLLHISLMSIGLFWMAPLLLSSIQLFVFGTYLPHRHGGLGHPIAALPHPGQWLWSLLSCYHFGQYHWAHHTYPKVPWHQLPRTVQLPGTVLP